MPKSSDKMKFVDGACFDGMHTVGWENGPKSNGFRRKRCSVLDSRFGPRIPASKRLYTLEAERWLHLAELKSDHDFRDDRTPYQGVERKKISRHLAHAAAGVILLESDALIECAVKDFSPAGVGLALPEAVFLPTEFDLSFNHTNQRCTTVWRHTERMGVKFKAAY
jgi:hypothetical protein